MSLKFSEFIGGGNVRVGDKIVGLRNSDNYQFTFPGDGILDDNGNYLFSYSAAVASVNYINYMNANTGDSPKLQVVGQDATVNLDLDTKGNGNIQLNMGTGKLDINSTVGVSAVTDDTTLSTDSSEKLPTEHAVKTYVDSAVPPGLTDYTYVTKTDETANLPNSEPLSTKSTGIIASTTGTGEIETRVITGTTNEVDVSGGDGSANPTISLSSTLVTPGTVQLGGNMDVGTSDIISTSGNNITLSPNVSTDLIELSTDTVTINQFLAHSGETTNRIELDTGIQDFEIGGSSIMDLSSSGVRMGSADARITSISDDTTLSADSSTLGVTQHAVKTYVDNAAGVIGSETFITNTDETVSLPNSDPLSTKSTGILASTTGTGALNSRVITGTTNEVDVANGDGSSNPTLSLSSTLIAPGTLQATTSLNVGGAGATITQISDDTTLGTGSATLGVTQNAVKTYVDNSTSSMSYGRLNFTDSGWDGPVFVFTTTLAELTGIGFGLNASSVDFDEPADGRLRYTGTDTKTFLVTGMFHAENAGNFGLQIYKNGVAVTDADSYDEGDGLCTVHNAIIELAQNDYVSMFVVRSANGNNRISSAQLTAFSIV